MFLLSIPAAPALSRAFASPGSVIFVTSVTDCFSGGLMV
jgi:hypothetical protein